MRKQPLVDSSIWRKEPLQYAIGYGASLIGDRPTQEDVILLPDSSISEDLLMRRGYLALLCDGMGGLSGGDQAAQMCAQMLMTAYYDAFERNPVQFYRWILPEVDRLVSELTDESGMPLNGGTTLVSVIIQDRRLYWASVGDSRVYLFRGDKLCRLSKDHTVQRYLLDQYQSGTISELDWLLNEHSHRLISYIGMNGLTEPSISTEESLLKKGDVVLLCSDGLYHALRDDEIEAILRAFGSRLEKLSGIFTQLAYERDWILHDNISAVVLGIQ